MLFGLLVFAAIVGSVIWFATAYNSLTAAEQRAAQAWGNVDALLRQRHDELPRLLDASQPYLRYEQAVLDRVLDVRTTIFGARQTQDTAALGRAEAELRAEIDKLRALASAHPALQADQTFAALERRIAALEAGIAERRDIYNDAVQQNNVAIGRFPGSVVARLGGFRPLQPFEFATAVTRS
jgi:LemA protein